MDDILRQIVARKEETKRSTWEQWEREFALDANNPWPKLERLPDTLLPRLAKEFILIAECKQASPSKGILRTPYDPVELAQNYVAGGAHAISILTEEHFFKGSYLHLQAVRQQLNVPLLCKDFLLHPADVCAAYRNGADLVLFIKRILDRTKLKTLLQASFKLGLTPIIEIFDATEGFEVLDLLQQLQVSDKVILGINNRNLKTFEVTFTHTFDVMKKLKTNIPIIGESGIRSAGDMRLLQAGGCRGALVGETLLRAPDVTAATSELLSAIVPCP